MKNIDGALNMKDIFAPEGAMGLAFGSFERRQQQIEMAEAVQEALAGKRHLVVEAGTGVGKSLAYLVPAIEQACISKSRVVVSTFTISLQEQLINKDIPCLGESLPWQFKAVLARAEAITFANAGWNLRYAGRWGFLTSSATRLRK